MMELLRARGRITEPEARYYLTQVVEALRYMHHDKLVLHRDIKLGNLFLNEDLKVKIGDFGLAAQLEDDTQRKKTICGTPNYIAPEILSGASHGEGHSFEVDIWSVGVVLYTLLVGTPPFETNNVSTTYKKIKATAYTFPTDVPVSDAAKDLIRIILTARPEKRPNLIQIQNHDFFSKDRQWINVMPLHALEIPPDLEDDNTENDFVEEEGDDFDRHSDDVDAVIPPPVTALPPTAKSPRGFAPPVDMPSNQVLKAIQLFEQDRPRDADEGNQMRALTKALAQKETLPQQKRITPPSPVHAASTPVRSAATSTTTKTSSVSSVSGETDEADREVLVRTQRELLSSLDALNEADGQEPLAARTAHSSTGISSLRTESGGQWVCKWIDYSSKYGLGYQICDGRYGVYFNDASKLIHESDKVAIYIERTRSLQGQRMDKATRVDLGNESPPLSKKVTLLGHFSDFLAGHLGQGQEEPLTDHMFKTPVYVKKWMKTRHATIFFLSNRTIQVVFCDKSEIILGSEALVVTYRTKSGRRSTHHLRGIPEIPGLSKRLRYTNDVLAQLVANGAPA
eukprot:Plantae.Rhodophyta-Rhodochaete_pulchella.ctg4253.p1 GENE.Plantae.Rhodophyta-Rhodochaete_pulchella.ctg4253~~Plantae.Rhodophyta-Rhodochaete_pulchella.ctg4253.p1  ORF type:complete len:627 (+),score=106.62 Plantae.Rhodophyta-Rhodochaete_pulchella.ctg4253:180-1883(+)